jgi:hypothetical protein
MGHEQASTTLDRYTRTPDDYAARILVAFDRTAAYLLPQTGEMPSDGASAEDDEEL